MTGGNETGSQAVSCQNLPSGMAERRVYQIQVVSKPGKCIQYEIWKIE